jgi:hypothetical protein
MDPESTALAARVNRVFDRCFQELKQVAEQNPTADSFRQIVEPLAGRIPGFFDASLIDTNFVIRQVYMKRHFLARGYDLNHVGALRDFLDRMHRAPAPQLSEPARGGAMQPSVISMRYPVLAEGKLIIIVSLMIRTEAFLAETGLDRRPAWVIFCQGRKAEASGTLSDHPREITLPLPSTEWVIRFD